MSMSSPPVSSRIMPPNRRHSFGSWVCSSFQNFRSASERLMISSAPMERAMAAFSSLETTQTGTAPPLRAYCVANPPSPPDAPQISSVRLLPGEVVRLGHQLSRLDQRDVRQPPEVGLEAPDALLGVEHRVVV